MHAGIEVRELTPDELEAARHLGRLAFGSAPTPPPPVSTPVDGVTRYGAFDPAGRLLGKATDLHHDQWWNGRRVPAADVAGVAVLPEARGRGVARAVLSALLAAARDRGAAVSALYPTVSAPYRALGWEVCGALRTVDLPTAALPRPRPAPTLTVSPGDPADLPEAHALYTAFARHRCGLLSREGGWFASRSDTAFPDWLDGLTLVRDGDRLVGYAGWERGRGYDHDAVLTVPDLLAVTADAAAALVGVLASWRSVTPTVRLTPAGADALGTVLPTELAREHRRQEWMHRPVDVVRAVGSRGWPATVRGAVEFVLHDPVAPWNDGGWRLEVADGTAELRRRPAAAGARLSVRGFALLYTGAASAAALLEAGLLVCDPGVDPSTLDLLAPGRPARLLDYF